MFQDSREFLRVTGSTRLSLSLRWTSALGVPTVERHWTYARTWLYARLKDRNETADPVIVEFISLDLSGSARIPRIEDSERQRPHLRGTQEESGPAHCWRWRRARAVGLRAAVSTTGLDARQGSAVAVGTTIGEGF
jgi:hypothetical protein